MSWLVYFGILSPVPHIPLLQLGLGTVYTCRLFDWIGKFCGLLGHRNLFTIYNTIISDFDTSRSAEYSKKFSQEFSGKKM